MHVFELERHEEKVEDMCSNVGNSAVSPLHNIDLRFCLPL